MLATVDPRSTTRFVLVLAFLFGTPGVGTAQTGNTEEQLRAETYVRPPEEIAQAIEAPRHLNVQLGNPSPDGTHLLATPGMAARPMSLFAKPFYRLGGLQIDRAANRDRRLTLRASAGINIVNRETGNTTEVQVPVGAGVTSPSWSPDGTQVAFLVHLEDATHIFVADRATGRSRQITRTPVLATLFNSIEWTPDGRFVVTILVPARRGSEPVEPAVPAGPQVRHTTDETNRLRTYPDLLQSPWEQQLLEYYATGQITLIDTQNRRTRTVGGPGMYSDISVSPTGSHILVEKLSKPFSYIVPVSSFGNELEVWDIESGAMLQLINQTEVDDGAPDDTTSGVPDKRSISWRPDGAISFLQSVPRGEQPDSSSDSGRNNGRRSRGDRVMEWLPPFGDNDAKVLYENNSRMERVTYSEDSQTLFVAEQQGDNAHEFAVHLSDPETKHTIWRGERPAGFRGRGVGPTLATKNISSGVTVVRTSSDGSSVYLTGTDYSDTPMIEGPESFVDRVAIDSGESTRIYESGNDDEYIRVVEILNNDAGYILISRESATEVPDNFSVDVGSGTMTKLTNNVDYTPDLTNADRRRYNVTRVDGLEFAVQVTLPADWSGERLPGLIWFYPREYTGQDQYDEQVRDRYNRNAFPNLRARSMDVLVRLGYAVIEPDAPIIGDQGQMNNNYIHDLRNNLAATIDFLDREGIIDRQRMGVGGHSYGAFSTVNAMAHTPFFKAGIAGDGNFNRTLTPFAFQSERRTLWENRDLYYSMSPIFFANNITGALLLYHGADDQNVGTFPIHSWRLFETMESLGKKTSLYVYPYEEHGPAAEETLMDLWARWTAWLDLYVKNAAQENSTS